MRAIICVCLILFYSCGSTAIYNKKQFEVVNESILNDPEKHLRTELRKLLKELKKPYTNYEFNTIRHFILEAITLKFDNQREIKIYFDRRSEFDFGGGIINKNEWNFDELQNVKISVIKIYEKGELISHHCIYNYCRTD